MPALATVRVGDCACPDTPHADGDEVYLTEKISLEGGLAAQQDIATAGSDGNALTRRWLITFVRFGAVGWNLRDEDGPRPFDVEALLADFGLAEPVADRAAELYSEAVMRPLLRASSKDSPTGSTRSSTRRPGKSRPS